MDIDWGTVPDWLVAVGTIGAVVFALVASGKDGVRLRLEQKNAAEDRELFREQQAAAVEVQTRRLAASVTLVVEEIRDLDMNQHIKWTVHNGSTEPISMVSVVRRVVSTDGSPVKAPVNICETWTSIEAGGQREKTTRVYDDFIMREGEVQFRDGMGQRWQRMEFGTLRKMDPGDPDSLTFVLIQR